MQKATCIPITGNGNSVQFFVCTLHSPDRSPLFRGTMNDLDVLQGTWNLVSAMEDGKALPEDHVKQTTIVIKGNTFRFPGLAEDATAREGAFKLDATKNPKEIVHLHRGGSLAWHLRTGTRQLQDLLRSSRQTTSNQVQFRTRQWSNPPSLAAAKE